MKRWLKAPAARAVAVLPAVTRSALPRAVLPAVARPASARAVFARAAACAHAAWLAVPLAVASVSARAATFGAAGAGDAAGAATSAPTLAAAPSAAASAAAAGGGSLAGQLTQLLLGLLVVLGVILALAWVVRRVQQAAPRGGQVIDIVSARALGPRDRLVLVQVGEEQILLGVSPGRITSLHVMKEPVSSPTRREQATPEFAQRLMDLLGKEQKDKK